MPSPFPGMDPWLENPRYFADLHDSLIYNLQEAVQPLLPAPYYASKSLRVWLEVAERPIGPDVYIMRESGGDRPEHFPNIATIGETGPLVVTAEPPSVIEAVERFLEIWTTEEGHARLVTSIEILSPSNEAPSGDGRTLYLKKQREVMMSSANLVEIDILRGGLHSTAVPRVKLFERAEPFDYHVCLHCFDQPKNYYLYPFRLADPLPEIAIPLLPGDPVLTIALQPIFDRSYDAGAFRRRVPYLEETPDPPLSADQMKWARSVLENSRDTGPAA